jgi:cephalosporin-C deacetylase-like acetyl esterase
MGISPQGCESAKIREIADLLGISEGGGLTNCVEALEAHLKAVAGVSPATAFKGQRAV